MIPVTKAFIPPLESYNTIVRQAFESGWLTNRGELVRKLEKVISERLGVSRFIAMNNGTVPLQIALSILGKRGEIITTPFSYVATTSSIVWQDCTPVFVDIDADYLTIDERKIEAAITDKTTCILATHVFGNPCNIEAIQSIARKHNIHVIYDAAHCFGVRYQGKSIFEFGDVSTCSFHATKLFHTGEGGAFFSNNLDLQREAFSRHNFGHKDDVTFHGIGINGKMSELQAAMGLAVFPHLDHIIAERRRIVEQYDDHFVDSEIVTLQLREGAEWNYSYYPVVFPNESALNICTEILRAQNIIPRRYFYPSLNTLPYVKGQSMPVSESIASRVLCLPLYPGLNGANVNAIAAAVKSSLE